MPRYDRTKAVRELLQRINGTEVSGQQPSDIALLVCGCPARCTHFPQIPPPRMGSFVLSSLEDFEELARKAMESR